MSGFWLELMREPPRPSPKKFCFYSAIGNIVLDGNERFKTESKIDGFCRFFFAVIACVSPRDHCEEYSSLDSELQMCVLGVGLLADCREQLALGAMSEEDCKKIELLWMDGCYSYATDSERCSKEIDLSVIPKIVNRQMKPDAADFIRWRKARSQVKAVNNQSAI